MSEPKTPRQILDEACLAAWWKHATRPDATPFERELATWLEQKHQEGVKTSVMSATLVAMGVGAVVSVGQVSPDPVGREMIREMQLFIDACVTTAGLGGQPGVRH